MSLCKLQGASEHFRQYSKSVCRADQRPQIEDLRASFLIQGRFPLSSGQVLDKLQVAFRLTGPAGAPLVVVAGGISAHRDVSLHSPCGKQQAWWPEIVGIRKAIDTENFQVLSYDYLGGNGETFGPKHKNWLANTEISTADQAQVLALLLDHLHLEKIDCFVGASYGGMVGLAAAAQERFQISRLLVLCAACRPHKLATAWRIVQRKILELCNSKQALALARALAMTTYRSPEEFECRFSQVEDVEAYLNACGNSYAEKTHPLALICLSNSIDRHAVNASEVKIPCFFWGVSQDQIVPTSLIEEAVAAIPHATLTQVESYFGHDAFLKETEQVSKFIRDKLGTSS